MKLLLDTSAFLWWYKAPQFLSPNVRQVLSEQKWRIYLSAASAWEVATKVRLGKLPEAARLIERFDDYLEEQNFVAIPVSTTHARLGGSLASPHRDPFDRIIAAQAQIEDMPVATTDVAFQTLGVRIFW